MIVRLLSRPIYVILAITIVLAGVLPIVVGSNKAYAYGEVTSRSISLSTSQAGTAATYLVKFTPATTSLAEAVVLNFCDDTPLIGVNCGWTSTSQSLNDTGTLAITNITNTGTVGTQDVTIGSGHWTIGVGTNNDSTNNGAVVVLSDGNTNNFTSGDTVSFTITGLVNPNYIAATTVCAAVDQPNCTYYGRILTYSATTNVSADYVSSNPTVSGIALVDAGGIALSTSAQITVTAKVQEQITFCVFATLSSGGAAGCGTANSGLSTEGPPSIGLGSTPNDVLSSSGNYTNKDVNYQIQTNAGSGAAIFIYGDTLTSGANSISGIDPTASLVNGANYGTAQFGLCSAKVTTGSGTFTIESNYTGGGVVCAGVTDGLDGDNGNDFFFDGSSHTTMSTTDQVAQAAAGTYDQGLLAFAVNIPVTQAAGVYVANIGLVANGTY